MVDVVLRFKPYVAALVLPALFVLGLPSRLPAFYAPCFATAAANVVVGQITKSRNAAGQWQASADVQVDITCSLGLTSDCRICLTTHADVFDGTNWVTVATGSGGILNPAATCNFTLTYTIPTTIAPLFPSNPPIMYRYTADVGLWTGSACAAPTQRGARNFGF
jgi:hypothetical protein